MLKLTGEFVNAEQKENSKGTLVNYVKILCPTSAVLYSVKVNSLKEFLTLQPREVIEIGVKVNAFNNNVYYQSV